MAKKHSLADLPKGEQEEPEQVLVDPDSPPADEFDDGLTPPEEAPQRVRVGDDLIDPEADEENAPETDAQGREITTLTDEERKQFVTLMSIGRRRKKVDILGHEVVLSSLMSEDELLISEYVKPYMDTLGQARAYQIGTLSAAIVSVDGEQWGIPLSESQSPEEAFYIRERKVRKLHPFVIGAIYEECRTIETEFAELARKLGKR